MHANCIVRILNPGATPYRAGTHRDRAWSVLRQMDGMTVQEVYDQLKQKEMWIQNRHGRPLGWLVDAVDRELAAIERPD
jgi:hypothetical protein